MSALPTLLLCLCWCSVAAAQVAFTVAGGTNSATAAATAINFNITCSGSNRFILVQNSYRTVASGVPATVAATYNANATTSIRSDRADSSVGNTLLYYATPDDVSRAVECTLNSSQMMACTAMCFSGVDSGAPLGTSAGTYNAAATECDVAVTVATDGLAAGAGTRRQTGGTWATDDTSRNAQDTSNATASNNVRAVAATAAGAGSVTIDWTSSDSREMACSAVPLNAVAAAPSPTLSPAVLLLGR